MVSVLIVNEILSANQVSLSLTLHLINDCLLHGVCLHGIRSTFKNMV